MYFHATLLGVYTLLLSISAIVLALPTITPNTTCTATPRDQFIITNIYVFSHIPGVGWEVPAQLSFVYNTPDFKTSFPCSATNFPTTPWACSDEHPEIGFMYDIKPKILSVFRTCEWAAGLVVSNGTLPQSQNMTLCSIIANGTHGPGTYCNSVGLVLGTYSPA